MEALGNMKPTIVVSKCLGFDSCRYNALMIKSDFVTKLNPYVNFIPVCPEVEIGLGVPRSPIRLEEMNGEIRLIQPKTGLDVSEDMQTFSNQFLSSLTRVDGFILKGRSPSCGIGTVQGKGIGFFGGAVLKTFPGFAIEEEGRLLNEKLMEHFLQKIFILADWYETKQYSSIKITLEFQARNKLLLMSYSPHGMREIGKLLGTLNLKEYDQQIRMVEEHLHKTLSKPPRIGPRVDVLQHAFGFFSDFLVPEERAFFLESIESYRTGKVPFTSVLQLIKSWVIRFKVGYLQKQTFFHPYPPELFEIYKAI
jgi:uncharacterized protein YbgA (DUF1722 family)/uncharacterized protein YbbK (DUF523 family)